MKRILCAALAAILCMLALCACSKKNEDEAKAYEPIVKSATAENFTDSEKASEWIANCKVNPLSGAENHLLVHRETVEGNTRHYVILCRSEAEVLGSAAIEFVEEDSFYRIKINVTENNEVCEDKDIYYLSFDATSEKQYIYDVYVNGENVKEQLEITSSNLECKD